MTPMPPTTEDFYRGMGRMVVRFFGRTPGSDCVVATHAILACSGLDNVFLNCGVVFGDGPGGEDPAEERLGEFVARIRALGVGGYLCLGAGVQGRLEPLAHRLGLSPLPPVPLLARPGGGMADPGRTPDETLAIGRVGSAGGLSEFLAVSEAAFALPLDVYGRVVTQDLLHDPALSIYVARLGSTAVACVCLVEDDGLAGISGMATLPDMQRRGIEAALLDHVLAAHGRAVRAFFLTASDAGTALYRGRGFTSRDLATAWVVPPPA